MFEKVLVAVYGFLGISALAKNEEGKSILTAEQKTKLEKKYGSKFVNSFEEDLAEYEKVGSADDTANNKELNAKLKLENEKMAKELKEAKERNEKLEAEKKEFESKIEKMGKDPVDDNGEEVPEGGGSNMNKFKPDMKLGFNKHIADRHAGKSSVYEGDTTIETDELKQEFGRYIAAEKVEIFRSLLGNTDSLQYMTTMITDKFKVRATHAHITSVLQSFVPKWTPKGKTKFTPLDIEQFPMKINVEIVPSDVIDEVLGYMYDENLDPQDMPIVKYIIENLVKPTLDEERETAFAVGRYVEPAPGADGEFKAGEANAVCNGYLTQLCDIKRGGNAQGVNFLFDGKTLGTGSQLVTDIETIVDSVSKHYKKKKMFIHCDPDIVLKYSRAYRDKYPNTKNQDGEKVTVDYTNLTFGPVEGMRGTGAFIITPKENFRHLMSRDPRNQKLRMATQDYTAKVYGEWREGVGFWLAEAIFAYIPDELLNKLSPAGSAPAGSTSAGDGL